ncbi:MAG: LamG domain-containing protein [Spirochaetia bacterium]|nr:LamG domain-containing protein [Spirochaetia bacterium]
MMIYLDGTLASQANASGASVNTVLSSLSVGKSNFQGDNLTGSIDDVRIYNRALNATDVSAVYAGQ